MTIPSQLHEPKLAVAQTQRFPVRAGLVALLSFFCVSLGTGFARAQTVSREYHIKAVLLYNIVQFTEWPTNSVSSTNTITIGIMGTDPFGAAIDEAVRGQKKEGRALVVHRVEKIEDATNCHALFISKSESARLPQILTALRGRPVLTVGETEDFAQRGGMIQFTTEKNRIRLRINVNTAQAVSLIISSKLLRLADTENAGKD